MDRKFIDMLYRKRVEFFTLTKSKQFHLVRIMKKSE